MPITSLIQQPAVNSLNAAYRPIVFRAVADGSIPPPVVYCDIYFNGIYYRTISKTLFASKGPASSEWQFDIQDPAQEYLKPFLGANGGGNILNATPPITSVFCRFRSSVFDSDGFINQEYLEPVQGTATQAPVPGDGFQSNTLFILNATLQHQDNQSLPDHLGFSKTGTWAANCYPATHRPSQPIAFGNSDYFPVLVDESVCLDKFVLSYKLKGEVSFSTVEVDVSNTCSATITSITAVQLPASTNIFVTWAFTGTPDSFNYRIDGGVWLSVFVAELTLTGLSIGSHNIEIVPVCSCSNGTGLLKGFPVADASTTCTSVVTIESVTASGDREVTIVFSSTGPATAWRYRLNGGSNVSITSTTLVLTDLSIGEQSIVIEPVCSDSQIGVGDSSDFEVEFEGLYYTYTVRLSISLDDHCATPSIPVYSGSPTWESGISLCYDIELSIPVDRFNWVSREGENIYVLDRDFGIVGLITPNIC